jgi:hypothetical protein
VERKYKRFKQISVYGGAGIAVGIDIISLAKSILRNLKGINIHLYFYLFVQLFSKLLSFLVKL